MKVLVCEDNQLAMKTLTFVLGKEGYELDTAEEGNRALALLQKSVYNLIIVDIHLPYHSGLELIKYLRSDLKMDTPVLVLSAFSDLQIQNQARELGISGYIVKPFKMTDLIAKMSTILKDDQ
jgi:DNA-binding response OmpR family regulator